MKNKFMIGKETRREFHAARVARALRIGSKWVFFRAGRIRKEDPWDGWAIRITGIVGKRPLVLSAELCPRRELCFSNGRAVPAVRRVKYSELW